MIKVYEESDKFIRSPRLTGQMRMKGCFFSNLEIYGQVRHEYVQE